MCDWSSEIFDKNVTEKLKPLQEHHFKAPASYLSHIPSVTLYSKSIPNTNFGS